MAIITSIINLKGGVGKTTLTHHLGTGLTYKRNRTLMLDLDPQCNLSYLATGVEGHTKRTDSFQALTIKDVFESFLQQTTLTARDVILMRSVTSSRGNVYNYVDLVYSHPDLMTIDIKLSRFNPTNPSDHAEASQAEIEKLSVIKRFLHQVEDDYDYIFLDCPPSLNPVTQNAIFASDYYLIPAMPDHLSTVGISRVRRMLQTMDNRFQNLCAYVDQPYRTIQCAGIVFNKVNEYGGTPIRAHQHFMHQMREIEPALVYDSYLVEGHGVSDAAQKNQPVYAYNNQRGVTTKVQRQIDCLNQITSEFLNRIHGGVPA